MRHAPALQVSALRKVYRDPEVVANDGINFSVEPGTAFGLLGPNGAGKTTLVRQLVGLMKPTSGSVLLFGEAVHDRPRAQRIGRHIAYLPQGAFSLGELKVREALLYTAMLRGCGRDTARTESDDLMDELELGPLADRQLRKVSGGQRRLTQLAMTLVGRLPVLILDEPTTDIDPALRSRIWTMVSARAAAGAAVVLVTHDVAEAEHVLNQVAILHEGRIVASGTPAELKSRLAHRTRIEVVMSEGSALGESFLTLLGPELRIEGRRVSAWVSADEAVMTLEKVVSAAGPGGLEDVRLVTPTLEDVYLDLGGHHLEVRP